MISRNLIVDFVFIIVWVLTFYINIYVNINLPTFIAIHEYIALIFLPAGIKFICAYLLEARSIPIIFIGCMITNLLFNTNPIMFDVIISLACSIPMYLTVYIVRKYKANIMRLKIIILITFLYSIFSSILHNIIFYLNSMNVEPTTGILIMFIGDLLGVLIIIYLYQNISHVILKMIDTKD